MTSNSDEPTSEGRRGLGAIGGVAVGHWTDERARTGCTVVLLPEGTTASGEIRGGAPATREFGLLDPNRTVARLDAVVLSGGSAFGLAAADGVVDWLAEQGRGFPTAGGAVPIVVGLSLYDLTVGDGTVRPGPPQGRAAAAAAQTGAHSTGAVGAGAGATWGKWGGPDTVQPGGVVAAVRRSGDVVVAALVAVNAFGFVDDGRSTEALSPPATSPVGGTNTTIGVVVTNVELDPAGCFRMSQAAHNGLARSLLPAHTAVDGDAFVAAATGEVRLDRADLDAVVRMLATQAVSAAVRTLLDDPAGNT